ncbi:hypothetical protein D7D52_35940 [Nocardia yunnanensis]|uniref:Uncharacterized protein n=1 Tax=Nocardia yunnanensis TaxID=2382165 RepID=A0A386ZKE2_9NOCA|nr:hypothetical protein [Nocardia yunnanensis]AYF78332.1 hypothetical protein D7D52_35940 [Nocardia yunnanensis]
MTDTDPSAQSPETVHGFHDGERVRDRRDGSTSHVRFLSLTPTERATGEYAEAEIVFDALACRFELDEHTAPHLDRLT